MMILLGEAVTNLLVAQIDFFAYKHKIRHYARLTFLAVFCTMFFGEGSNSVIVSGRLANLIMISEEHWKNEVILFQNIYGNRGSVVLRVQVMLITYCFCDFLFHGYPCMTNENVKFNCRKKYGFHLTDKGHAKLGHL